MPLSTPLAEDDGTNHAHSTVAQDSSLPGPGLQHEKRLDYGIASVAEDGQTAHNNDSSLASPAAQPRGRLEALLNGTAPPQGSDNILTRPARPVREASPDQQGLELNVPRRELPFERSGPKELGQTPRASINGLNTPPLTAPRGTAGIRAKPDSPSVNRRPAPMALRKRRLADLNLGDFKVNPKNNEGFTFAYSEVVRNKSERAELPGCTDENCCGKKFREMALNERDAVGPALLQQGANIKLLEDFLGDDAYRLGSMNRQEKEDLWVQAKVRDLANRFGRHKHRYTRRPSPPGFWNPDMPSTQELAKEREETDKAARKQVEERYRDAMRGNGRWLFRDE